MRTHKSIIIAIPILLTLLLASCTTSLPNNADNLDSNEAPQTKINPISTDQNSFEQTQTTTPSLDQARSTFDASDFNSFISQRLGKFEYNLPDKTKGSADKWHLLSDRDAVSTLNTHYIYQVDSANHIQPLYRFQTDYDLVSMIHFDPKNNQLLGQFSQTDLNSRVDGFDWRYDLTQQQETFSELVFPPGEWRLPTIQAVDNNGFVYTSNFYPGTPCNDDGEHLILESKNFKTSSSKALIRKYYEQACDAIIQINFTGQEFSFVVEPLLDSSELLISYAPSKDLNSSNQKQEFKLPKFTSKDSADWDESGNLFRPLNHGGVYMNPEQTKLIFIYFDTYIIVDFQTLTHRVVQDERLLSLNSGSENNMSWNNDNFVFYNQSSNKSYVFNLQANDLEILDGDQTDSKTNTLFGPELMAKQKCQDSCTGMQSWINSF